MSPKLGMSVVAMLALAGCGGGSGDGKSGAGSAVAAGGSGWNAADACATFDKGKVGTLLKSDVTSTDAGPISDGEGAGLGGSSSQCSYMLADGRNVFLQTIQSAKDPGEQTLVAAIHKNLSSVGDSSAEDIGGAGKATVWAHRSRIMYALYGGGRYATVAVRQLIAGKTAYAEDQIKADELALLRTVSG